MHANGSSDLHRPNMQSNICKPCGGLKLLYVQVGLKYGLPLLSPVDDSGIFTEEAGPFKGLQVCGTAAMLYIDVMTCHAASCRFSLYHSML